MGKKLLRNQLGMNIMEVMVAASMVSIMVYSSSSFYKQYKDSESIAKYRETASNLRQIILALLTSEEAWNNTVENNPGTDLDCLRSDTTIFCPIDAAANTIKVYTASGTYQDSSGSEVTGPIINNTPTSGFTKYGARCDTFNASPGSGNDNCPIRIEVDWRGACTTPRPQDTSTCKVVQSLIEAKFFFNSSNQIFNSTINISNLNFKNAARLIFESDTPSKVCTAKGMFYLPVLPAGVYPDSTVVDPEGCVPMSVF